MTTGELRLRVKNKAGRMIAEESYVSGAFKLGKPIWYDHIPLYYLLHVGGGYLSGDAYTQQIELLEHTSLYLTTQAATKVYKGKTPATMTTTITIGEHSHLSLLQDPLILFENATYHQKTFVELHISSTFYYSEIITPGWSATHRPFMYDEFLSHFQIKRAGKYLYIDRLHWTKGTQQTMLHLDRFTHYGTYLCIEQLPEEIYEWLENWTMPHCSIGLSTIENAGFVCKIVASHTQAIEHAFSVLDQTIRNSVQQIPITLRKY
jgi:urease accessory protein